MTILVNVRFAVLIILTTCYLVENYAADRHITGLGTNTMNFSIEQLNSFVAVYEQGSFSKAAVQLDKHRTTIGQVINNLEDELAVELFQRIGRTAKPTADAKLLYSYAKLVVEQARSFDKVALSLSFGELESINIAYNSFIPPSAIRAIRVRLLELHPTMKVNFTVKSRKEIRDGILADEIQFGLINADDRRMISSIQSTLLSNLTFSIYAAKDSDIAKAPKSERWGLLKTTKQLIIKSLLDDKMGEKIIISADHECVDQLTVAMELVQHNVGWATLPRAVTYTDFDDHGLVEIETDAVRENFRIPVAICSPHSKQLRTLHSEIASALVSYVERVNKNAGIS